MPTDEQDPLQSLIADILEAENRGESVDAIDSGGRTLHQLLPPIPTNES